VPAKSFHRPAERVDEEERSMADLIYTAIMSLDGYIADEDGNFDWSEPSEEVHSFLNDLERSIGTYLFGRRLYDVMAVWETIDDPHPIMQDYARIWRAADKIVFSRSLETVSSERTRIERSFDSEAIRTLKASSDRDIGIGGPTIAADAFEAGLVDEVRLFLSPVIVGGGTRGLPDGVRLGLELRDERRFDNGTVYVRYRATNG
jgi:dihydrofolate reductase